MWEQAPNRAGPLPSTSLFSRSTHAILSSQRASTVRSPLIRIEIIPPQRISSMLSLINARRMTRECIAAVFRAYELIVTARFSYDFIVNSNMPVSPSLKYKCLTLNRKDHRQVAVRTVPRWWKLQRITLWYLYVIYCTLIGSKVRRGTIIHPVCDVNGVEFVPCTTYSKVTGSTWSDL